LLSSLLLLVLLSSLLLASSRPTQTNALTREFAPWMFNRFPT